MLATRTAPSYGTTAGMHTRVGITNTASQARHSTAEEGNSCHLAGLPHTTHTRSLW